MNMTKEQMERAFPSLHGRGEEIRSECSLLFKDSSILTKWKEKFPPYMHDMVYNNYIAPLLVDGISEVEQKKIVRKLDMFCASII
jgi:hypothetical protein